MNQLQHITITTIKQKNIVGIYSMSGMFKSGKICPQIILISLNHTFQNFFHLLCYLTHFKNIHFTG